MRKSRTGLALILVMLLIGLTFTAESIAAPVKVKRKATHHVKHKSKKSSRHFHKAKRIRYHRVPPEKSLALLRQYLPDVADIYETNLDENTDLQVIPVGAGYDFRSPFSTPELRFKLIASINRWLGTRYRFGGSSKRGIDCSGFTSSVLSSVLGKSFAGPARIQAQKVERVELNELQFGDLMFFTGRKRNADQIGHVGIYIGNGIFAHSSTGRGVIYTHISEGYYIDRFRYGGRIIAPTVPTFAGAHQVIPGRL